MSDYTVMVKEQAKVFLGGPPLVKMATGEESDDESLGGAEMHARTSGLADYLAADEHDAIRIGRRIVARLNRQRGVRSRGSGAASPRNHLDSSARSASREPDRPDVEDLLDLIPDRPQGAVRPARGDRAGLRRGLGRTTVRSSTSSSRSTDRSLVTGWAKLHGHQIGILANAQGVLFSEEAQKATQFIQLANQVDVPLLFLHNTTGYMVGAEYEQGGIIKHGAQMINAVSNSTVPHLSIIMGASYGAGNYGMNGRAFDPRFLFTWPSAKSAVMGPAQLAGVLVIVARAAAEAKGQQYDEEADKGMREFVEASVEEQSLPFFLSGMLYDDGVIDPRDTRTVLGICLSVIANTTVEGRRGLRRLPDVSGAWSDMINDRTSPARRQPGRDRPPGVRHLPPARHRDRGRALRRRRGAAVRARGRCRGAAARQQPRPTPTCVPTSCSRRPGAPAPTPSTPATASSPRTPPSRGP